MTRVDGSESAEPGAPLHAALARAVAALHRAQRDDGGWPAPGDIGPAATAEVAVCLDHAGALTKERARSIARWLQSEALPEGGFVAYPSAPTGDLGATAVAAAFLARHGDDAGIVSRARAFVAARGGADHLLARFWKGDTSAVLLAMAGDLPAERLPSLSLAPLTLPSIERRLLTHVHGGILMTLYASRLLVLGLRARGGWLAARERAAGVRWLTAFQNDVADPKGGSWNAWAPVTAFHVAALRAAGLPLEDPRVEKALRWLEGEAIESARGSRWHAFETPLWATLFTVHALLAAGESAGSPALQRATDWVLAAQCRSPQSAFNHVGGGGPRTGGFAFRADNPLLPDCDDAGAALGALAALRDSRPSATLDDAIRACEAWLLGMQNPDGGFASYVCGLTGKSPGPLFADPSWMAPRGPGDLLRMVRSPPRELGDPSTEDVTGRVLHGLGLAGRRVGHPAVDRALAFLRAQQMPDGAFWGRWLTNYLAATSYAIRGALAVGAREGWITRGVEFLLSRQQPSGAWGESIDSYAEPATRGRGAACPAVTGRVLCALIEAGGAHTEAVRRGVAWLLAAQRADGTWDGSRHLAVIYPPDRYYRHEAAGTYYPLWALSLASRSGLTERRR